MQFNVALLYGAVALMSLPASAQRSPATPDPADAGAPVPAVKYESAFAGYAPFREEKLAPWREMNDEVGRVGGHMGIFRAADGGPDSAKRAKQPSSSDGAPAHGHQSGHK